MAITKIEYPTANQPIDLDDYKAIINVMAATSAGTAKIGITEFDNTTVLPKIKNNAVFATGGSVYQSSADQTISGTTATGDNYIYLTGSGTLLTPTWTQTAPTWNYQYNHYVTAGGDYVLPILVDVSGSVYTKYEVQDRFLKERVDYLGNKLISGTILGNTSLEGTLTIGGQITPTTSQSEGTWSITSTTYTIPAGLYMINIDRGAATSASVKMFVNGSWKAIAISSSVSSDYGVTVLSTGSNVQLVATGGACSFRYLKG